MLDSRNVVTITGGVTRTEVINDNILKFGLAVDFAASDKSSDQTSGYFDVVYYMNGDNKRNNDFIRSQVEQEKFKKGSQVQILGRLVQERWTTNDTKGQRVVIVAEQIDYARGGAPKSEGGSSGASQAEMPDAF